jgi:hypothetical protein
LSVNAWDRFGDPGPSFSPYQASQSADLSPSATLHLEHCPRTEGMATLEGNGLELEAEVARPAPGMVELRRRREATATASPERRPGPINQAPSSSIARAQTLDAAVVRAAIMRQS